MEKRYRILTTKYGEVNSLAKMFSVNRATVWNALRGNTESAMVEQIRSAALHRGAVEVRQ